jgi:glutamate--cysteine ligase catalytic subunit
MRFKPPPADNSIGWRVEFRPMEIQVTDFENAAFAVFIVLVTRVILSFDLNFYIPIARVDENMETAHARDAVLGQRFWFRRNLFTARPPRSGATSGSSTPRSGPSRPTTPATPTGPVDEEYRPMSVNEIINGTAYAKATERHAAVKAAAAGAVGGAGQEQHRVEEEDAGDDDETGEEFPGLIPLVESYLDSVNVDVVTRCELATYLDLIRKRASGELWTAARWIRQFVAAHPAYQKDSVVSEEITKDLVGAVVAIGEREQEGKGFAGLGVPDLDKLLGGFRGVGRGCGGG